MEIDEKMKKGREEDESEFEVSNTYNVINDKMEIDLDELEKVIYILKWLYIEFDL
jgi:hypothetical protein